MADAQSGELVFACGFDQHARDLLVESLLEKFQVEDYGLGLIQLHDQELFSQFEVAECPLKLPGLIDQQLHLSILLSQLLLQTLQILLFNPPCTELLLLLPLQWHTLSHLRQPILLEVPILLNQNFIGHTHLVVHSYLFLIRAPVPLDLFLQMKDPVRCLGVLLQMVRRLVRQVFVLINQILELLLKNRDSGIVVVTPLLRILPRVIILRPLSFHVLVLIEPRRQHLPPGREWLHLES